MKVGMWLSILEWGGGDWGHFELANQKPGMRNIKRELFHNTKDKM
jgi:hypothetical protein